MTRKLQVCIHHRSGPSASCGGRQGAVLLEQFRQALLEAGSEIGVEPVRCFVRCEHGPNVRLVPDGTYWSRVTPEQVEEIIACLRDA